jgi:hypothetical protein
MKTSIRRRDLMASYALLLTCSAGTTGNELEGVFDNVQWVSSSNSTVPNPNTQSLSLNPGDQVAFAVNMTTAGMTLNWVCVIVTATTTPGNRGQRLADNNSPFQVRSGKPATVLLASNTTNAVWPLTGFNAAGAPSSSGPYFGIQNLQIYADIPPGSTRPGRGVSQFEAVVVASCTDANNVMWQYGFDPEMDVNNNN